MGVYIDTTGWSIPEDATTASGILWIEDSICFVRPERTKIIHDHGELIDGAELWEKASRSRADAKGMVHLKTLTSKIDPSDYIAWNIRLDEREMFERMVESAPVIIPAESTMGQVKAEMAVIPAERIEDEHTD